MSLRLFLVDDEPPARERMKALLGDIAEHFPHELVGEAASPVEALASLEAARPDVLLLDVQMPGMNGIEFARYMSSLPHPPAIVFVTAFDDYALAAFDVHAVDYLLKPVRAARLQEALARAAKRRESPAAPNEAIVAAAAAMRLRRSHFPVAERGRLLMVPVEDVLFLKAEMKYVTLHARAREYLIEESLVSIEEEMGDLFVRVHRNALVARKAIIGFERSTGQGDQEDGRLQESWEVLVDGSDERLLISRRQWPVLKTLLRKKK